MMRLGNFLNHMISDSIEMPCRPDDQEWRGSLWVTKPSKTEFRTPTATLFQAGFVTQ